MSRRIILPVALLLISLLINNSQRVGAQTEGTAAITAPASGETVLGVVTINGTAASPNFQRYTLDFALMQSADELWFPIAEISQQVTNGALAQWNTRNVPDGAYQIRLRVILRDGSVVQTSVQNVLVANASQTPLPTPPQAATTLPATPLPTEGPSPTPLIQQPPTGTPRPTLAVFPTAPPPPSETPLSSFVIAVDAIRNAFCTGVYLAVIAFGIGFLYRLVYGRLRPRWRQWVARWRGEE
ncbi:MAG TPA: hypothetical protein PLD47_01070 [Aggregatilineales bacterium]|nr:hypothetical protein [Anaerolineales bacterium]HRE46290.1 hypothetical protein [Aggregatilineales bacterium]